MEQQTQGLDWRLFITAVINGKWVILAIMIIAAALMAVSNHFQALRYKATAQIQIDLPPNLPNPGSDVAAQSNYILYQNQYFKTEETKLSSRRFKTLFAEELKRTNPGYASRSTDSIVSEFDAGVLETKPVEETNLLTVSYTTDSSEKAASWLNTYVDLFVEENRRQQEESVKQSRDYFGAQLEEIKKMLESQQGQISQYAGKMGMSATSSNGSGDGEFLYAYKNTMDQARQSRTQEEQKLKRLEPFLQPNADLSGLPSLDFASNLDSMREELAKAKAAVERMYLEGKGEGHPSVVSKKAEVLRIEEQLRGQLEKIAEDLRTKLKIAQRDEKDAAKVYDQKRSERAKDSLQQRELSRMDKTQELWTTIFASVEEKLRSLKVMEGFVSNNISVVERAISNQSPESKRGLKFVILAGIAGMILGMGIVVAGELMNPKIKSVEEIQTTLDVPALGFLPRTNDFSLNEIRESYNVLRTEFLFRRDTHQHRVVMVTSSIPKEGKTTVTMNLARTLASAGDRTVVLDFDLRKARLRSLMSSGAQNGNRVFSPVEGLNLQLEPTDIKPLHLVVANTLPQNPPFLLSQPPIKELIEYFRSQYDWVLIDTPPVTSVTDPVIIASLVDTILFVVKYNFVDKRIVRNSLASLLKVKANIMGAVLNDLDMKKMSYYSYNSYYRYYTESDSK
jgi:polysaccharide biosynthesis transport protein